MVARDITLISTDIDREQDGYAIVGNIGLFSEHFSHSKALGIGSTYTFSSSDNW